MTFIEKLKEKVSTSYLRIQVFESYLKELRESGEKTIGIAEVQDELSKIRDQLK
tara:strand:- start:114 stop:275 length:162 start_codon:yes stop_codon:yes gene_type:complete